MTRVPPGTRLLGSATLVADDPADHARNKPSFYADPVAWLVAETVDRALADCAAAPVPDAAEDTGILVMSATGTRRTMRRIAGSVPRSRVSPLRFAGANPGVLAGLPALRHGLRGPSLLLAAHPDDATPAAFTVIGGWFADGHARHVFLVGLCGSAAGRELCSCLVLTAAGADR
ncbi:polyketide synthase [Streptomyces sp. NRRL F-4489]|uniref:polyketide synthase n=1 Tax=Streptomyces sp. NRRL F-4489 TaxID=1609095 RepID=UPI000746A168|nr:polyketide synthase [Streptomyces sp. NRRL F-4489]KUL36309.1 polyketide synthase [Streptomyces sp. NRRL F-4489]